jgi:hypothetical protein
MSIVAGIVLIALGFLTLLGAYRGVLWQMGTSTTTRSETDVYPKSWMTTLVTGAVGVAFLLVGLYLID